MEIRVKERQESRIVTRDLAGQPSKEGNPGEKTSFELQIICLFCIMLDYMCLWDLYKDDQWLARSVNKEFVGKIEVVMHCATTFWSTTEHIYDGSIPYSLGV